MLPRQSGKNEVQRHLFGWLLYRAAERGGTIVSVAPRFKPQTINAMERTRMTLDDNIATRGKWRSSAGFVFRFHKARVQFFSGEHTSKVVGATADLLLSVDEAQDIDPAKIRQGVRPDDGEHERDAGVLGDGVDVTDASGAAGAERVKKKRETA